MENEKKSFILYADLIHTIEKLPPEKAGKLFMHILKYVNNQDPISDDFIVEITFEPIKQQLERDYKTWEEIRKKRSAAGKKSAEKRKHMSTSVNTSEHVSTNSTVNVNVNDNVNVNNINIPSLSDFIKYAVEKKYNIDRDIVKLKYDAWVENGWKDGNDKKIKNWKSKLLNTIPHIPISKRGGLVC